MGGGWRDSQVFAFTESDGPGRPPAGAPRVVLGTLAAALGAVMFGVMMTDALCPEHRAWVDALAGTAVIGSIVAIVGLLRGWASSTWLTLLVAASGVGIGVLDTLHDPRRGTVITLAFAVVALGTAGLLVRDLRLRVWDRHVRKATAASPLPAFPETTPAAGAPVEPAPELPERAADRSPARDS